MRTKKLKRLEHYRAVEREATRRARKRMRLRVWAIKSKLGCSECPERNPICLDFHHTNPDKKSFTIQHATSSGLAWKKIIKEIKKCQVLCRNCHAKHHYKEYLKKA